MSTHEWRERLVWIMTVLLAVALFVAIPLGVGMVWGVGPGLIVFGVACLFVGEMISDLYEATK